MIQNRRLPRTAQKPSTSRRERIARRVTGGVVILSVAAVAVAGLPALATAPTPHLPSKSLDTWAMPLDRYVPVSGAISDYVEMLMIEPCMADAGYTWAVPGHDAEAAARHAGDVTVHAPLTLAAAGSLGYHAASTLDPSRDAWIALNAHALSDEGEKALETCLHAARKIIPRLNGQQSQAAHNAVDLSNEAFLAAENDRAVIDAAGAWRRCMASAGVRDLPETPAQMPSPTLRTHLRIDVRGTDPSRRESQLATRDVRCQLSSGYRQALYDAEWARQATVSATNAEEFRTAGDSIANNRVDSLARLSSLTSTTTGAKG